MSINLKNAAILNTHGVDYRCITIRINKSDAVNLLQNAYLIKERGVI